MTDDYQKGLSGRRVDSYSGFAGWLDGVSERSTRATSFGRSERRSRASRSGGGDWSFLMVVPALLLGAMYLPELLHHLDIGSILGWTLFGLAAFVILWILWKLRKLVLLLTVIGAVSYFGYHYFHR